MPIRTGHDCEWCKISHDLWGCLNRNCDYRWPINQSARQSLYGIIPHHGVCFDNQQLSELNLNLRAALAPHLTGADRQIASEIATWIVRDWGRIRRGVFTIGQWSDKLGDYSDANIERFLEERGKTRISSWSKLLAFADPHNHAIYDSRTSVAINCGLSSLPDQRRFFMPQTQNRIIRQARQLFLGQLEVQPYAYRQYISLLRCFVHSGCSRSILNAEMAIFSNAPDVVRNWLPVQR